MKRMILLLGVVGALFVANGAVASEYTQCLDQVCPSSIPAPYRQMCIESDGNAQCGSLPGGPYYSGECEEQVDRACLNNLCPTSIPYPYRTYCLQDQNNINACTVEVCS